jgi:hypothetical protein
MKVELSQAAARSEAVGQPEQLQAAVQAERHELVQHPIAAGQRRERAAVTKREGA